MKKLMIVAVLLIAVAVVLLNPSMVASQATAWVNAHPKDPDAALILYRTGRWCDFMGGSDTARGVYLQLTQQYPKQGDLCAPALYYIASDMADGTYIVGLKKQALPYLQTIQDQYPEQTEWVAKAKELYDQVDKAH